MGNDRLPAKVAQFRVKTKPFIKIKHTGYACIRSDLVILGLVLTSFAAVFMVS